MIDGRKRKPYATIFVVHTPFQIFMAEHMVRSMGRFAQGDRVLAAELRADTSRFETALWSRVMQLPVVGGSVLGRGRVCRGALRELAAVVDGYVCCEIVVSDIAWPLNNAIAATLSRRRDPDVGLSIFPDGLVTYLGAAVTPRIFLRGLMKAALGWFGGAPYMPYRGDVTGAHWPGMKHIYTPLPDLTPAPEERIVPIPASMVSNPLAQQQRGCVYLGQNVEHYLSRDHYEEFCLGVMAFVRGLGYDPIVYKPHHFESDQSRAFFKANGLEILEDHRSIEQIFLERPFECVVSYNTSAFVNLKLMYGRSVRCISYGNEYLIQFSWQDRAYGPRMRELFERLGVEIVDVPVSRFLS